MWMDDMEKCLRIGIMVQTSQNGSQLEIWVTRGKMGHTVKCDQECQSCLPVIILSQTKLSDKIMVLAECFPSFLIKDQARQRKGTEETILVFSVLDWN